MTLGISSIAVEMILQPMQDVAQREDAKIPPLRMIEPYADVLLRLLQMREPGRIFFFWKPRPLRLTLLLGPGGDGFAGARRSRRRQTA
jgi:hypothetical protein